MKEFIGISEAHEIMFKLGEDFYSKLEKETLKIAEAANRVLSEDIVALLDFPEAHIATMDGFALSTYGDFPKKIVKTVYAGDEPGKLEKNEACRIATGAFLPDGANTVIKQEDAQVVDKELLGPKVKDWNYVMKQGCNFKKNDLLFRKGHVLKPQDLAVIKAAGYEEVCVYRKINIGVFANGDELLKGKIKDTNSMMISAFLKHESLNVQEFGILKDDYTAMVEFLKNNAEHVDIFISSGGVSVGDKDFVIKAVKEYGEVYFHKVKLRPGKPVLAGKIFDKLIFGLPGKPVGCFVGLNVILSRFFKIKTMKQVVKIKADKRINVKENGFHYVIFANIAENSLKPFGYIGSSLNLFADLEPFRPSVVSASIITLSADGYIILDKSISENEEVDFYFI